MRTGGLEFVMRRSVCEYEAPARFDDPIEVFIRTARIGRTSQTLQFQAWHAERDAALRDGRADDGPDRPRHAPADERARRLPVPISAFEDRP